MRRALAFSMQRRLLPVRRRLRVSESWIALSLQKLWRGCNPRIETARAARAAIWITGLQYAPIHAGRGQHAIATESAIFQRGFICFVKSLQRTFRRQIGNEARAAERDGLNGMT